MAETVLWPASCSPDFHPPGYFSQHSTLELSGIISSKPRESNRDQTRDRLDGCVSRTTLTAVLIVGPDHAQAHPVHLPPSLPWLGIQEYEIRAREEAVRWESFQGCTEPLGPGQRLAGGKSQVLAGEFLPLTSTSSPSLVPSTPAILLLFLKLKPSKEQRGSPGHWTRPGRLPSPLEAAAWGRSQRNNHLRGTSSS